MTRARRYDVAVRAARAILAAATLVALSTGVAYACSSARSSLIATPTANTVFLLGTARTDTMRTGAGSVVLERELPAADMAARRRNVHGQLLDVERTSGPAHGVLPSGTKRVILVPWAYSSDCRPVLTSQSAVWEAPGTRGVYFGELRSPAEWIGGVPTVDVFRPQMMRPYMRGVAPYMASRQFDTTAMLTEDAVLDLMDLVPPDSTLRRDPETASAKVFSWARANPERARFYPARDLLEVVSALQQRYALQSVRHPATGTYRLTLRVNDGAPYTLFARTVTAPVSGYQLLRQVSAADPLSPTPFAVWSFQTFLAANEAGLPSDCRGRYDGVFSYVSLLASPPVRSARGLVASGAFELKAFSWIFLRDTVVSNAANASFQDFMERRNRNEPMAMGTIEIDTTGAAHVTQVESLAGGRRAVMTGERLSLATIECEPQ